jgi:predicted esterase
VDVFEAIEHVKTQYGIDKDRITITGASMGGAATWYLISHYPDLFAAAAPFCGYCDYRLWEKPGGLTFRMQEWEEPSWISRSAAFLVENLQYTPVWMVHGKWDRAVGGGVPVEHSRQMASLMGQMGQEYRYTEVPATGHSVRSPELFEKSILWLLKHKKKGHPKRVQHSAYMLRHNRSYWATIEQFGEYGRKATIDAKIESKQSISVSTRNIQAFSLSPEHGLEDGHTIEIDGQVVINAVPSSRGGFWKDKRGAWQHGALDLTSGKRHGVSGPIGDLFFERLVLVPGTVGAAQEAHVAREMAKMAVRWFADRNGGVHRGGKMGDNEVELPVIDDVALSDTVLRDSNLLLYGTFASNAVLARFRDRLPLAFDDSSICLGDREFAGDGCAVFAVFPHPENPQRYIAVHGGTTPDAICWGSHLDMQLLPDYIVYAKGELLDWGFWDNEWRLGSG